MKRKPQKTAVEKLKVAVVGYGRVGRACVAALKAEESAELAGVVVRAGGPPERHPTTRFVPHVAELGRVDAALVCVPTTEVIAVAHDLLQHRIRIVECATLHGEEFMSHREELDRMSLLFETPAVVGAGWDPGAVSIFRGLFSLLVPRGETETTWRTAAGLHRTPFHPPGVRRALETELSRHGGGRQRFLYAELERGARPEAVELAAAADPFYAGEETVVIPVTDLDGMAAEHGLLLERKGSGATRADLILEGRYVEAALAAQAMVAALRALPGMRSGGARTLFDIPLRYLIERFERFV